MVEQPIRNRQVASSTLALGSSFPGSGPGTWVIACIGHLGNNFGPDGLSFIYNHRQDAAHVEPMPASLIISTNRNKALAPPPSCCSRPSRVVAAS